jgi:hypothetical protein
MLALRNLYQVVAVQTFADHMTLSKEMLHKGLFMQRRFDHIDGKCPNRRLKAVADQFAPLETEAPPP